MAKQKYDVPVVGVRLVKERKIKYGENRIGNPEDVRDFFVRFIGDRDREAVALMCMDAANTPLCVSMESIGSLNSAPASRRELAKTMILANAAGVVLAHNHPSGRPQPSQEDLRVTDDVQNLCDLLNIELLDHVIVTQSGAYYSFREHGFLRNNSVEVKKS